MPNRIRVVLRVGELALDCVEPQHGSGEGRDGGEVAFARHDAGVPVDRNAEVGRPAGDHATIASVVGTRVRFSIDASQADIWTTSPIPALAVPMAPAPVVTDSPRTEVAASSAR